MGALLDWGFTVDERKIKTAGLADMVVFSIDPAADIDYLRAALQINPIEICFTEVADGEFSYYAIYPQGISVSLLKNGIHNHLMPDIDSEPYQRCLLDRSAVTGLRLIMRRVTDSSIEQFLKFPPVFKPNRDTGVMTAAPKVWRIVKSEEDETPLVTDPCNVPATVLDFLTILDAEIPDDAASLNVHRKRVELRVRFLEWYAKRFIARDVREFLNAKIALLTDRIFACDIATLSLNKSMANFPTVFADEFRKSALQHLPADIVDQAIEQALSAANQQTFAQQKDFKQVTTPKLQLHSITRNSLEQLFSPLNGHPGLSDAIELLLRDDYDRMQFHQCSTCGRNPRMITEIDGAKKRYQLACGSCKTKPVANTKLATPLEAVFAWNRQHPAQEPTAIIRYMFGSMFENKPFAEIVAYHARVKEFLDLSAKVIAEQDRCFSTHASLKLVTRHSIHVVWLKYLGLLLSQARHT
jgi:hypothetical protein